MIAPENVKAWFSFHYAAAIKKLWSPQRAPYCAGNTKKYCGPYKAAGARPEKNKKNKRPRLKRKADKGIMWNIKFKKRKKEGKSVCGKGDRRGRGVRQSVYLEAKVWGGKALYWHALVWARLDGCILDKIPWASVSRASWAGRGGQSCSIQLRILDITVLVARVLETREGEMRVRKWGSQKKKKKDMRVRKTDWQSD